MYDCNIMLERIKEIKRTKKINNEELAQLSGIPFGTLAKILAGETKEPKLSYIIKIAHALDVSANYIIFGEEKNNSCMLTQEEQQLLSSFTKLNSTGKAEALKRMHELTKISDYTFSEQSLVKKAT